MGKFLSGKFSLKIDQDRGTGGVSKNNTPVLTLGGDSRKLGDNVYEITPENHKAPSSTAYTGESMKDEKNILRMKNNLRDLAYTGRGDRDSKKKHSSQ